MSLPDPTGPSQSKAWYSYFLANRLNPHDLLWDDPDALSPAERHAIQHSIQQFQLGESAEGRRLLDRGRAYSRATGDAHFSEALALFIKEEQRHSATLLRFMRAQGIPQISSHWVDSVFRRLRVLAGLELSLRVLVTAEVIAVPYYRALGRATASPLLRAISSRILQDEFAHLKFQSSMLSRLAARRIPIWRRAVWRLHRLFLVTTSFVVWAEHGKVFRAAGYAFEEFILEALVEFAPLASPTRREFSDCLVASRTPS
jgi:hypothetical protein